MRTILVASSKQLRSHQEDWQPLLRWLKKAL